MYNSIGLWLSLLLIVGMELREKGCVTLFRSIHWEEIASFDWKLPNKGALVLRLNLRNKPVIEKFVDQTKKDMADQVLSQHICPSGQGFTAPVGYSQTLKRKRTIQGAAQLLIITGILQTIGPMALMMWLMQRTVVDTGHPLFIASFVLAVINTLLGATILVGAVKMYRRRDYRFCRAACILAVLPFCLSLLAFPFGALEFVGLGVGPVLMLSGIWGLCLLRKAEFVETFCETDRPGKGDSGA